MILNFVDFFWKLFKFDGGFKLIKYLIEMRDIRRFFWNKVEEVKVNIISYIVSNLIIDNEYVFRVFVINEEG